VNENPRCAVMVKPTVSGFEITVEEEELLLAAQSGNHVGLHHSSVPKIGRTG